MLPLFKTGYKKDLELSDLFRLPKWNDAETSSKKLGRFWTLEVDKYKGTLRVLQ